MNKREQIELYRADRGDEAAMRQIVEAENRLACCGELRAEGHHPDCRQHPAKKASRDYRTHFGDKLP